MANLVLNQIKAFEETMVAWRHDLHMHPEIGFEEHRTYDNIARTLAGIGYEVHRNVGKTGVVGRLAVGDSKRSIGLRADMAAIPIEETNQFSHRSTVTGPCLPAAMMVMSRACSGPCDTCRKRAGSTVSSI
jgi:hippurate hydrolase